MLAIFLVGLMVFAAFVGALALSEWGANHWVRTRPGRQRDLNAEYSLGDPFDQDDL